MVERLGVIEKKTTIRYKIDKTAEYKQAINRQTDKIKKIDVAIFRRFSSFGRVTSFPPSYHRAYTTRAAVTVYPMQFRVCHFTYHFAMFLYVSDVDFCL